MTISHRVLGSGWRLAAFAAGEAAPHGHLAVGGRGRVRGRGQTLGNTDSVERKIHLNKLAVLEQVKTNISQLVNNVQRALLSR